MKSEVDCKLGLHNTMRRNFLRFHFICCFLFAYNLQMVISTETSVPASIERNIVSFCEKGTKNKPLDYNIFNGRSSLRGEEATYQDTHSKAYNAMMLLLREKADAAHEVILGVKPNNVAEAEYAAAHPGTWNEKLTDTDDRIHSLIHRSIEGDAVGEGKHTGWENACYWAAGGPKSKKVLAYRNDKLIQAAHKTSLYTELVPRFDRSHQVIAGGGESRKVKVAAGCWDPIAFIKLNGRARELSGAQRIELEILRQQEVKCLIEEACGGVQKQ